jgi:hypothetical protein
MKKNFDRWVFYAFIVAVFVFLVYQYELKLSYYRVQGAKAILSLKSVTQDMDLRILKQMSMAAEKYATDHEGKYPTDMTKLIEVDPPYLKENFCWQRKSGYLFQCDMSEQAYHFTGYRISKDTRSALYITNRGMIEVLDFHTPVFDNSGNFISD